MNEGLKGLELRNLGLKWKQTAEEENMCNSTLEPGSS